MATFRFWFKQIEGDVEVNSTIFREPSYGDLSGMEMRAARDRAIEELMAKVPEELKAITRFEVIKEGEISR